MKGKVKFFNTAKGFGFIAGDDGKEYFVHQTALTANVSLRENDVVSFDVVQGDRGPKASRVSKAASEAPAPKKKSAPAEVVEEEEAPLDDEEFGEEKEE